MFVHGKSNHPLYRVWNGMKQRCYNPNDDFYSHYGGKGVSVCEEWKNDFLAFYTWAIENGYRKGLTIDRIDVNGDYCPTNCRWATNQVQQRNRTDRKKYDFFGHELTLVEISEITGIKLKTLWMRNQRGKPIISQRGNLTREEAKEALRKEREK